MIVKHNHTNNMFDTAGRGPRGPRGPARRGPRPGGRGGSPARRGHAARPCGALRLRN